MIHSATPTVPPVAITMLARTSVGTDVKTTRAKIVITTGRECGSASWINLIFYYKKSLRTEANFEKLHFSYSFTAQCDFSDEDMSVIDSQEELSLPMSGGGGGGPPGSLSGKTNKPGSTSSIHSGHSGNAMSGASSKKGGDRKSARARTVLSEKQLNILKTCYSANPRPDALMKEQLVEMTGLSPRVIRVWFQNKRCKDKKIQSRMMEKQMQRETVS